MFVCVSFPLCNKVTFLQCIDFSDSVLFTQRHFRKKFSKKLHSSIFRLFGCLPVFHACVTFMHLVDLCFVKKQISFRTFSFLITGDNHTFLKNKMESWPTRLTWTVQVPLGHILVFFHLSHLLSVAMFLCFLNKASLVSFSCVVLHSSCMSPWCIGTFGPSPSNVPSIFVWEWFLGSSWKCLEFS